MYLELQKSIGIHCLKSMLKQSLTDCIYVTAIYPAAPSHNCKMHAGLRDSPKQKKETWTWFTSIVAVPP